MERSSVDGMPLVHCVQCGKGYGYWQVFGILKEVFEVCFGCGEPFIMKEELE